VNLTIVSSICKTLLLTHSGALSPNVHVVRRSYSPFTAGAFCFIFFRAGTFSFLFFRGSTHRSILLRGGRHVIKYMRCATEHESALSEQERLQNSDKPMVQFQQVSQKAPAPLRSARHFRRSIFLFSLERARFASVKRTIGSKHFCKTLLAHSGALSPNARVLWPSCSPFAAGAFRFAFLRGRSVSLSLLSR
jgi:hypothetical protein